MKLSLTLGPVWKILVFAAVTTLVGKNSYQFFRSLGVKAPMLLTVLFCLMLCHAAAYSLLRRNLVLKLRNRERPVSGFVSNSKLLADYETLYGRDALYRWLRLMPLLLAPMAIVFALFLVRSEWHR